MSSTNPLGNLYTVVCLVNGEAATFNDNLRREVQATFNAKLSTLPPHFTIKEGFKYDGDISELVSTIEEFCRKEKSKLYEIDGFGHFGKDVIYMNVELSNDAKAMHDRLIDEMSKIPYIQFNEKDGKNKNFHITIASKQIKKIFDDLYEFVNKRCCIFDCKFDNVTIFKWGDRKWEVYRQFSIPE